MTTVTTQEDAHTPMDVGPSLQFYLNTTKLALATTIDASSSINSNLIYTNGYKIFSFAVTSDQDGSVSIQRYLDTAGTIAQGSPTTASVVGGTPLVVNNSSSSPSQTLKITITNSGGSIANLTNVALLFQSS